MMARHLRSPPEPSPAPIPAERPRQPGEISPVSSSIHDTQGDIEFTHPDEDSSSTDETSDESSVEDTEMQDAHHERSEEQSTGILPEIQPAPQQGEETRETEAALLNPLASTSSPRRSGWSMTELLNDTVIYEIDDDEDDSSTNRPNTLKRKRKYPEPQTEHEKKSGFTFIADLRASNVSWDRITAEHNRLFGVHRSTQGLKTLYGRWKNGDGVENGSV